MTAPNAFQRAILHGLNSTGKHVFAGLETAEERTDRRREARGKQSVATSHTRAGRRQAKRLSATYARVARKAAA